MAVFHPHTFLLGLGALTTAACTDTNEMVDMDGDGYLQDEDCDDENPTVYPGSNEIEIPLDGRDQDCDGLDFCTDLNCDGRPDLVVTHSAGLTGEPVTDSYIYYGTESGFDVNHRDAFTTQGATDSVTADFNGDGYVDIVFANAWDGKQAQVWSGVYWGSHSGYSANDVTWLNGDGAAHVLAEDINGDSHLDIVFTNYSDGGSGADTHFQRESLVYWGDEGGFETDYFTAFPTFGGSGSTANDLNGDGLIDLAFAQAHTADHSLIYFNSTEGFTDSHLVSIATNQANALTSADLNADGFVDLVYANTCSDIECESIIYWGSIDGFDSGNVTTLPSLGASDVLAVDLNRDEYLDLIVVNAWNEDGEPEASSFIYWGSYSGYFSGNRRIPPLPVRGSL